MAKNSLSMADIEHMSARDAFGSALVAAGKKYPELVLLGADAIGSTRGAAFAKKYPDRTYNFGIAEQQLVSAAAGFALRGKIPVATAYGFLISLRACEQVRTDICYQNLNVKLMPTHTGLSMGEGGTTHHSTEDIAIMRSFANMTIVAPCDAIETIKAVDAVLSFKGPVYLRLGRGELSSVYHSDYTFEIGKAVEIREGKDVTLIAYGIMVGEALQAACLLAEDGIEARVINMHTIKPLDRNIIIKAAEETGAIVTAEEHNIYGGLGEAVAAVTSEELPVPVRKVAISDCFCGIGPTSGLLDQLGLNAGNIVDNARKAISSKR